jgi:hypothetical protein
MTRCGETNMGTDDSSSIDIATDRDSDSDVECGGGGGAADLARFRSVVVAGGGGGRRLNSFSARSSGGMTMMTAEDDVDDRPTLRRLASLDYYAGTPARRSVSVGLGAVRMGAAAGSLTNGSKSSSSSFGRKLVHLDSTTAAARLGKPKRRSSDHMLGRSDDEAEADDGVGGRPTAAAADDDSAHHERERLYRSRKPSKRSRHAVSEDPTASRATVDAKPELEVEPVQPAEAPPAATAVAVGQPGKQTERDEECARLLLGLGMLGGVVAA